MTHAFVRFRLPNGSSVDLAQGDIVGRLKSAALNIDDPRVSEAHAMVSLRRGELMLISLRRMFAVRAKPLSETILREGMVIELAEQVSLLVEEVHQPEHVLGISVAQLQRKLLPSTASLTLGPPAQLSSRVEPGADLHIWWTGAEWHAKSPQGPVVIVEAGTVLMAGANATPVRFELVENDSSATTLGAIGSKATPMHLIAWYDTVEIHRENCPAVTIGGVGARLLSELVAVEAPSEWHVIARELWKDPTEPDELRHRWDVTLTRLRAKLKEAGVRADLIRSTGGGLVQLVRYPSDRLDDRR